MRLLRAARQVKVSLVGLLAALVVVGVTTGGALTLAASSPDVIRACVAKRSGDVRVVSSGVSCGNRESKLTWNKAGIPGQPGKDGVAPDQSCDPGAAVTGVSGGQVVCTALAVPPLVVESEPNDSALTADLMSPTWANHAKATFSDVDDRDWYRFDLSRAQSVTATTSGPCNSETSTDDTVLYLYDANLNQIFVNDDDNWVPSYLCSRVFADLQPGTYYLMVRPHDAASAKYVVDLDIT